MTKPLQHPTRSEWAILRAVWEREPCAAPDVQEALSQETGWAYSTVRTLMDRMVVKGLLRGEKVRHMTLYRSAVSRQQAQRSELLRTLKQVFEGALTPMVQCLLETEELSAADLDALETLVKQRRESQRK